MVADPLNRSIDLQGCDDETEVRGYGLLQREKIHHGIIDLHFELIDLRVARDDLLGQVGTALEQGRDCIRNRLLGKTPHPDQTGLKIIQLLNEMSLHQRSGESLAYKDRDIATELQVDGSSRSLHLQLIGVVFDLTGFENENNILRDICGVVSESFDMAGKDHDMGGGNDEGMV